MTDSPRRLQIRVTLDSDMGALFRWASGIPERSRAREVVGLLRVGFAVATGTAGLGADHTAATDARSEREASAPPTPGANLPQLSVDLEERAADATLQIFDVAAVTGVPPL